LPAAATEAYEFAAPRRDTTLYHVKGVTGSYVSHGGPEGTPLAARVRYVGPDLAAVMRAYEASLALCQPGPVTITAPTGTAYRRCHLRAARLVRPGTATGRPGGPAVFMDAEFTFFSAAG
jgi:hypothetical protein